MKKHRKFITIMALLGLVVLIPASTATGITVSAPIENRSAAIDGADRLIAIQHADGSFPWDVPSPAAYQNVQGVTAMGLLDTYKVTLDSKYLDKAKLTRDWLATYKVDNPTKRLSASNVYFLAQYALLSLNPADLTLARSALNEQIVYHGSGANLVTNIITARKNQGHTNLGLWDASLFVRAAQDIGSTDLADEMANALATQSIVDPFNSAANWYEIGLTGIILGLSEADSRGHKAQIDAAVAALKATQADNGSFPSTYGGVANPDDTQTTAYAVMALASVAEITPALSGSDFIRSTQRADGSFAPYLPDDETEYGEVDSEAVGALVAATLLVPNGAAAYADAAVGLI